MIHASITAASTSMNMTSDENMLGSIPSENTMSPCPPAWLMIPRAMSDARPIAVVLTSDCPAIVAIKSIMIADTRVLLNATFPVSSFFLLMTILRKYRAKNIPVSIAYRSPFQC